jgi:hypothetical protein
MTRGSVILNGTHFTATDAIVTDDRGRASAQLDSGMVIRLRGRSDDGVTGLADRIDVQPTARGPVGAANLAADPVQFTLAGLVVVVDDQTLFAGLAGPSALAVGARVEVHGLRDSSGLLHATRIEAVGPQDGLDALRGRVGTLQVGAKQFTLSDGAVTVDYASARFEPAGASEASLSAGVAVEVHGTLNGNTFVAVEVGIEALAGGPFVGNAGERQDVGGFISGFSSHPGIFQVDGRSVRSTATTMFQSGTADDLANDVEVEVDGVLDAQLVLVATRIRFSRTPVILQGLATAVDTTNRALTVLATRARVDDLTRIDARLPGGGHSTSLADISANAECVDVRGHMAGTALVSERIRELAQCGDAVLQARVSGKDDTNAMLAFFGSLPASMPSTALYYDSNGTPITRAAFFAQIEPASPDPAGTLVKLRGTFAAGTFTADQAEIK